MRYFAFCLALGLTGCVWGGAKERAVNQTHEIDELADGIKEDMRNGITEYEAGGDPRPEMVSGNARADAIKKGTQKARKQITRTENKVSPWVEIIQKGLWVAGLVGVVILLIYLGVGKLIRPLFARFGIWVEPKTKARAILAAKAEVTGKGNGKEQIAVARATDPAFNAVYEKTAAKLKANK